MGRALSDADVHEIRKALKETNGGISAAKRLLAERGYDFSYGTIWNVKSGVKKPSDEEDPLTLQAKLSYMEAKNRSLAQQISVLKRRLGEALEFRDNLLANVKALVSAKPVKRKKKIEKSGGDVVAGIVLSDWHIGEIIRKEDMEGINKFDFEIAKKRISTLIRNFLDWIDVQRKAYTIDDLYVFCLGDFISGGIHDELVRTAEFPIPVQIAKAGELMVQVIKSFSGAFNRVYVEELIPDNHARLWVKRYFKQRGLSSYNYLLYGLVNSALEGYENIEFHLYESDKAVVDVKGMRVLIEHGDRVRGWVGIPYYGIEREEGKEARKRMVIEDRYDLRLMGHFHTCIIGTDWQWAINGSLTGMSELGSMYVRPSQLSFLLHTKKKLMFNPVKWDL